MTVDLANPQQAGSILSGVIPEQPDTNTVELATYGDTYLDVKSALYVLDMMLEIAIRDYERQIASCYGDQYKRIRRLLSRRPHVVSQDKPSVENYQELQDVRKAKSIYRAASTVHTIERWKTEVKAFGAMHGAYEYGQAMMDSGVSADLMRRVFKERASKGMTNSYASIRDMREGHLMDGLTDEERSLSRMAEMITAANEYERMMSEYPEDDSAERIEAEYREQLEKEVRRMNRVEEPEGDDGEGDASPMDPSVLLVVPDHVGIDFATDDDDDEIDEVRDFGDDDGDDYDDDMSGCGGPEDDGVPTQTSEEERGSIGPVASDADEALKAVPPAERLRIGPGTPDEQRFFLDSKYGRIERIGPKASTAFDAMDAVDKVLVPFMPPSHPEAFARWFGRTYRGELNRFSHFDVDEDDDGDIILIAKAKEESE